MKRNRVELTFDKSLLSLAGYEFGTSTFENQVKGKVRLSEKFELVFPSNIKSITSSFVEGLFAEIINTIGLRKMKENSVIISDNENFSKSVMSKL